MTTARSAGKTREDSTATADLSRSQSFFACDPKAYFTFACAFAGQAIYDTDGHAAVPAVRFRSHLFTPIRSQEHCQHVETYLLLQRQIILCASRLVTPVVTSKNPMWQPPTLRLATLASVLACAFTQEFRVGDFNVFVNASSREIRIAHPLNSDVWWTRPGAAFLGATKTTFTSRQKGECFLILDAAEAPTCNDQVIATVAQLDGALWLNGTMCDGAFTYSTRFSAVTTVELAIDVGIQLPEAAAARGWTTSVFYGAAYVLDTTPILDSARDCTTLVHVQC